MSEMWVSPPSDCYDLHCAMTISLSSLPRGLLLSNSINNGLFYRFEIINIVNVIIVAIIVHQYIICP